MPAQIRKQSGFTLVELLVVISIIAILSVIGITVFSGVQKSARDARRRADIDSITKALEVNIDPAGKYGPLKDEFFASGKMPSDPIGPANGICGNQTPPQTSYDHECNYYSRSSNTPGYYSAPDGGLSVGSLSKVSQWTICAHLETGDYPRYYCKKSTQ